MSGPGAFDTSQTAWISQGFERLVDRVRQAPTAVHFDVLIIGSGYGGAIAAATFAGRAHGGVPITVGVLERGKEYLPGAFPAGLGELPRHVRRDHNKEGLFDIRLGPEVTTVIANGVGGGSLINAGVMEIPAANVFQTNWPAPLKNLSSWSGYFSDARALLGGDVTNTIETHADGVPQKFQSIKALAGTLPFRPAAITVAMNNTTSSGNVKLKKCVRCGDCATGCNFGAKNSLDVNLLVRAQQNGAEIFSGATVSSVKKDGSNWLVNAVHTNAALRARDGYPVEIRARKVVLAAGALGSSEILMRSKALGLQLSEHLGKGCSTNGDMLITDYDTANTVHTVADEAVKPSVRAIGPTITGIIDLRATAGVLIEEMSVPAGLRLAFTEIFATVNTLHSLAEKDSSKHLQGFPDDDIYAVPALRVKRSALYAVMGDDGAAGTIELDPSKPDGDGVARIRWAEVPELPLFDAQVETVTDLTKTSGGRVIPNPLWKLLPADLAWLLNDKRGPLITVHPLGGCALADSGAGGVVDQYGRVFSSSTSNAVHDGLVVLDGSVIPTALGTNPALTIAAVALRAVEELVSLWSYAPSAPSAPSAPLDRPVFRETDVAATPRDTEVEIIERLVGAVKFRPAGGTAETRIVELTLRFAPKALGALAKPPIDGGDPVVHVATDQTELAVRSRIRIFDANDWQQIERTYAPPRIKEQQIDAIVEFSAPLSGTLRIFERRKTRALGRMWRAAKAWAANRGVRDTGQALTDGDEGPGLLSRITSGLALASRSGEIRAFAYDLTVGTPEAGAEFTLDGDHIVGTKTFTYERRCNPWRQLMEVTLEEFPGLRNAANVLKLDTNYLVRIGVPLFRVTQQQDGVNALRELVSFLGYAVRLLLGVHVWSFRAPDKDNNPPNVPNLLPGTNLPGLPAAEIHPVPLSMEIPEGSETPSAGQVLLTRYPNPGTTKRPVVMFHGYSASGTTFAHHAVTPNFAKHLHDSGRDVWIADLRTSSGQATATQAWSFDQIGAADVPAALKKVSLATGGGPVDVVAHCMGTVVFSMAVLSGNVQNLVDRAAFTQMGPLVVFSPANVFRAYALRYLIDFLPDTYTFRPESPTLADDLWDRLLATLPYPVEEFDVENPPYSLFKRTPWTRTRHRMDALYGRDFSAVNMEPEMLRFIDEHFGPLSLKTVSQTIHFARYSLMTNFGGRNTVVSRKNFADYWKFPTFSVHGSDNGLAHVSTVDRMEKILQDAGCVYLTPHINQGAGHQDALIGTTRFETFQKVEQFLDATIPTVPSDPEVEMVAYPPWIGPIITEERPNTPLLVLRVGSMPTHRATEGAALLRVTIDGNRILRPDDPTQEWDLGYILAHMAFYKSKALTDHGWDAFEAPHPETMPGFTPGDNIGNGLLVLLVYAESDRLQSIFPLYQRANVARSIVEPFNQRGPQFPPPPNAVPIAYARFERIASAVERVLMAPPFGAKDGLRPRGAPGSFVAVRAGLTEAGVPAPSPPGTPAQANSLLGFAVNTPTGNAALEVLVEQDRDLMDGVIPYDPPQTPPTAPLAAGTSFALASCQYPAGFIDEPIAYRAYTQAVARITAGPGIQPRFTVFAGDQVYVDPTAGLYDPSAQDDRYRRPYEAWLRQPDVRNALRRVPSFMLLDDHEIADNWEPLSAPNDDDDNAEKADFGGAAYKKYQRGMAANSALTTFDFDGFPFFMLNTRTARRHRSVGDLANAELFPTPGTMTQLTSWLTTHNGPKFVVSPAMLLPRHRRTVQWDASLDVTNLGALHSDGWDGYPKTLREVLAFIAEHNVQHVVFLSGDEHRACVARVELTDGFGNTTIVHSIHTAGSYSPFPFANSFREDFVASETIAFTHNSKSYQCVVSSVFPEVGDGMTFLRVRQDSGLWRLDYEFADGALQTLAI